MARAWFFCAAILVTSAANAQKKILDHSVYDSWRALANVSISNDGKWVAYVYRPQEGDALGEIRNVSTGKIISIPRVSTWRFTEDSKYLVATQVPALEETKKARAAKAKPEDMPKNNLIWVNLTTESLKTIEKVTSWSMASEGTQFLLYRPEPAKAPAKPAEAPKTDAAKEDKPKKKADHKVGDLHVLLNLATGTETQVERATSYAWDKDGSHLALAFSETDGANDRVELRDLRSGKVTKVTAGLGRYSRLTLASSGTRLAYFTDRDDYAAKKPAPSLYVFDAKSADLRRVQAPTNDDGFQLSDFGTLNWSESGNRLFFPIGPKPVEEKEVPEDEKVSLDVWNWKDPLLQPMQLLQATAEKNRTYECMLDFTSGNIRQLENSKLRNVTVTNRRDGRFAYASDPLPYQSEISWDGSYEDLYIIDLQTGKTSQVAKKVRSAVSASPSGNNFAMFDEVSQRLLHLNPDSLKLTDLTPKVPTKLFDLDDDHPDLKPPFGGILWSKDESGLVVKDKFDYWQVSTAGTSTAKNLTNGGSIQRRFTRTISDPDFPTVFSLEKEIFAGFDDRTKASGFYRFKEGRLERMIAGPKAYAGFQKAKDADTVTYTQGDAQEFPDLWLTNMAFADAKKITATNPQQKDYNWYTSELVSWRSGDGEQLNGLLIKPENFDYTKKYPMIAYFYERDSDGLHQHRTPAPSASTINVPLFASQGYVIFIPDIPYKIGYPGESAVSAIVSGCNSIIERGYIDPKRVGIQGQSWGGYQVAYLVTETNMFACAEAGAPVSNMFSAYGGIRYGSGMVRQFQYERGQSRIGGTPWNATLRYIENSPLFHLDKVQTPLMIMHNDRDGAVPYTQGIELFVGLRRLQKPAWMVVYNGEDHNLVQRKNRKDLSIRLSQFFDHFLKGAPMPEWMATGLPAKDKGSKMGLELIKN